ncbi:hypothetical protein CRT60_21800 [Azospirillum palustre]|uniref:Uncharacterized protein n=1 Tax=Azospirillum palustre TaxID=2044885 RepID=A0A2B8BDU5_9PROT|nr:hypothetical protein [Azospirillum palustre]PGH55889.1 hypothetical protein CRT60_21800 [Azospirillum palustre]
MSQQTGHYPTVGGMDLVTPAILRNPGAALGGVNYEPRKEGYTRIAGYERVDGRPLPSVASYWVLPFENGMTAITQGDTVTGGASGASGQALRDAILRQPRVLTLTTRAGNAFAAAMGNLTITAVLDQGGSYEEGTARGFVVLTSVDGQFTDGEALKVGGGTRATAADGATERGASNDSDDRAWLRAAIELQRAQIGAVPGDGPIRGIWGYAGALYAFRDNAGGAACIMHKATAGGWVAQSLGHRVKFTAGTGAIIEGQSVMGATSGASGVVTRVVVREGDWTGGNAAKGQLLFATVSGAFQNGENLQVGGSTKAVADGGSAAITLLPGGRFEFQNYNFTGLAGADRMYGCDGVNPAFEWDGSVFVPILTGMATDTPRHIAAHSNYLFLSFDASLQFSGLGDPYAWSVLTGAGELSIGQTIAGMIPGYAGTMPIWGRNRLAVLYGTVFSGSQADGDLKVITEEAGAIEWSVQAMAQPVWLDDRGVRNLASVQEFGDFQAGTLSRLIKPYLDGKRKAGATVVASLRVRDLNQWRLFWSDGTGLVMDLSSDGPAFMPLDLGRVVRCAASVEGADGAEQLYFGSDDGYVFRLDSGTSCDGQPLAGYVRLAFNHLGSPTLNKRFHKATVEVTAAPNTTLYASADFDYGNPDLPSAAEQSFDVAGRGGFWSEATWNEFYWSSPVEGVAEAYIDGSGVSISLAIGTEATYEDPHTIHGLTLHHSARGLRR